MYQKTHLPNSGGAEFSPPGKKSRPQTALVLGGGGARGAYEIGVWQALREMGIELSLVVGASVGSINAAVIAQGSFDLARELWLKLETDMVFDVNPLKTDALPLRQLLEQHLDETAVRQSTVEYGLVTAELPVLTPHYLYIKDIPKGRLIDYIIASSSVFPAILPQNIDNNTFVDGGYSDGIPVKMALARQAERIIAVDLGSGVADRSKLKNADNITLISSAWDLGRIITFDGENAERIMRLGYLETLKTFGFFDGQRFTFALRSFPKKELPAAETAGRIFDLAPGTLYTRTSFEAALYRAVDTYRHELWDDLIELQHAFRSKNRLTKVAVKTLSKVNEKMLTLWLIERIKTETAEKNLWLTVFREPWQAATYLARLAKIGG